MLIKEALDQIEEMVEHHNWNSDIGNGEVILMFSMSPAYSIQLLNYITDIKHHFAFNAFPKLSIDRETNTRMLIAPDFNLIEDTPSNDVLASYSMRKIFKKIKKFKLIFVLHYIEISNNLDRCFSDKQSHYPYRVIESLARITKKINNYSENIALIVLNTTESEPKRMTWRIVERLERYKTFWQDYLQKNSNSNDVKHINTVKEAIDLLKIFTTTDINGDYRKIGFYTEPKLKRTITNEKERKALRDIIFNHTKYITFHSKKRFFHAAKSANRKFSEKYLSAANRQISKHIDEAVVAYKVQYGKELSRITASNYRIFRKNLTKKLVRLNKAINETDPILTVIDFLSAIGGSIKKTIGSNLIKICVEHKILTTLSFETRQKRIFEPFEHWNMYVRQLQKPMVEDRQWLDFTTQLTDKLYSISTLRKQHLYNVLNIEQWGQSSAAQNLTLTDYTLKKFVQNVVQTWKLPEYFNKLDFTRVWVLKMLNDLIKDALYPPCKDSTDIDNEKIILCSARVVLFNNYSILHQKKVRVRVFGFDNVVIGNPDHENIELLDQDLAIISPVWNVESNSTITLIGSDGKDRSPLKPTNCNNDTAGREGEHGLAGLPGLPSGRFIGAARKAYNAGALLIRTMGGYPGKGQNGTDGCMGMTQSDVKEENFTEIETYYSGKCHYNDSYKVVGRTGIKYLFSDVMRMPFTWFVFYLEFYLYYHIAESSGHGGRAGDGGSLGYCGYGGAIILSDNLFVMTKENESRNISWENSGGKGGKPGDPGFDVRAHCWIRGMLGIKALSYARHYRYQYLTTKETKYNAGENGKPNTCTMGLENPVRMNHDNISDIIDHFTSEVIKYHYCEVHIDKYNSGYIKKLYTENSKHYNLYNLIRNLRSLEQTYSECGTDTQDNMLSFFTYYQERLTVSYSTEVIKLTNNDRSQEDMLHHMNEDNRTIVFLYTSVTQKINIIVKKQSYFMPSNFSEQMPVLLLSLKNADNMSHQIETFKNQSKMLIEKLDRINSIFVEMSTNVVPKIQQQLHVVYNEINDIRNKIRDVELRGEYFIHQQRAMKKELERQLKKALFSYIGTMVKDVVTIIPKFWKFMSVLGINTIGKYVDKISQPLESLLKLKEDIASTIKNTNSLSAQFESKSWNSLRDQLKASVSANCFKFDNEFCKFITNNIVRVDEKEEIKVFEIIQGVIDKSRELERMEVRRSFLVAFGTYKAVKTLVLGFVKIIKTSINYAMVRRSLHEQIQLINELTESTIEELKLISEFKRLTQEVTTKTLKTMEQNFAIISQSTKEKTEFRDLNDFKIPENLDLLKRHVNAAKAIVNTPDADKWSKEINTLENNIEKYTNLFNEAKKCIDDREAINRQLHQTTIKYENYSTNVFVRHELQQLDFFSSVNNFLWNFEYTWKQMKQVVFPFMRRYYEQDVNIPKNLSNAHELLTWIPKNIEIIEKMFYKYRTLCEVDVSVNIKYYSNWNSSFTPFYTWKGEEFGKDISDLLSGKSVSFNAPIKNANPSENAIKFNQIGITFRSYETNMQPILDNILQYYTIYLNHSGVSFFKCNQRFYAITMFPKQFTANFENNQACTFLTLNTGSHYLKDYIFSPFTQWDIQLKPKTGNAFSEKNYRNLKRFHNQVDLELVGHGLSITDLTYCDDAEKHISSKEVECSLNIIEKINYFKSNEIAATKSLARLLAFHKIVQIDC